MDNTNQVFNQLVQAITLSHTLGMEKEEVLKALIPSYQKSAREKGKSEREITVLTAGIIQLVDTIYA